MRELLALGLLLGFGCGLPGSGVFRFAGQAFGFGGLGFCLDALLLGLFDLARGLRLGSLDREGLAFAPAAFAQDKMGKDDGMMKKDTMSKDDGMKKDHMSKDGMKKDDGMMKKN